MYRPGFDKRTKRDLIEIVQRLSDPNVPLSERLHDPLGFVGHPLTGFEESFPENDRRRTTWLQLCSELQGLTSDIHRSVDRDEECGKLLNRTIGAYEKSKADATAHLPSER